MILEIGKRYKFSCHNSSKGMYNIEGVYLGVEIDVATNVRAAGKMPMNMSLVTRGIAKTEKVLTPLKDLALVEELEED